MNRTVGGTLVARILGLSKWGGPLSAYYELTKDVEAEQDAAMGRGKVLEASVFRLWEQRTGGVCMPWGKVTAPTMPYAHASLDRLGATSPMGLLDDAELIILEGKTLALEQAGGDWGPDGSDRIQLDYQIQVLWYHGVCREAGLRVADEALVSVLVGPEAELALASHMVQRTGQPLTFEDLDHTRLELRIYRVAWDPTLFLKLRARVLWFLKRHVDQQKPPDPGPGDLAERDLRAVAKGIESTPGEVLDFEKLPPATKEAMIGVMEASRQRKLWKEIEEQEIARAQLHLGRAEEVRGLPGGARVTWKTIKGGSRRFEVREPRR